MKINDIQIKKNGKEDDNMMKNELPKNVDENLLFVYGTLMKGERNHYYLKGCKFVGEAIIKNYELLEVHDYPGMVPSQNGKVRGEVYLIDNQTKKALDILEGSEYDYHDGVVYMNNAQMNVHFYEYKNSCSLQKHSIVNQDKWVSDNHKKDLIWYVSYGSNLLEERFDIYIQATKSKLPPLMTQTKTLPYELYFAKSSSQWSDKGVAFLDIHKKGKTYGKAYLIHQDQLEDIQKKEGSIWYDCIHEIEKDEYGISYVTLTHSNRYPNHQPSKEYLEVLGAGLKETYGFDMKMIENYLEMSQLDISKENIEKILKNKGKGKKTMKFKTLDFRKEVNHELLNQMEQEILKYQNFNIHQLKEEDKPSFEAMLEDFVQMQGEYGFFPLVVDEHIPNDCMYYYNRRTTYIILSLLMQNGNKKHEEVIMRALDGCLLSKFWGTSYEAETQQMENVLMLLKSGLMYYANQDMWMLIYSIIQKAKQISENSKKEFNRRIALELVNYFKEVK